MTARTSGFVVALVVALTLGWASPGAAETRNIDRTLPLSAAGAVTLDVHNGSIQVRTWDRPEVEVHVRIESHDSSSASRRRANQVSVDIEGSPDRVSIKSRMFERDTWSVWYLMFGDWADAPKVSYSITAPKGVRWRISDHNANAEIRDVNAALDVSTHNGSVRVVNLGGPLALSMHNGYANIDFASFTSDSRIATHNGTVELAMPAASRFAVDARGHHIHVSSDFPVAIRSSDFGRRDVSGSVNGGGPKLQLTAHNGGFRIRSK